MSYEYVEYVLASYLSSGIGLSEEDAVAALRMHLNSNSEFRTNFRSELQRSIADESFSWCRALKEQNVIEMADEESARSYVKRLLWDSLFLKD